MFQFPAAPTAGQVFTPLPGVSYRWNGQAWYLIAGPGAFISQNDADLRYVNVDEVPNIQNRIINGKFAIDQRNAGAPVNVNAAVSGTYVLDRWRVGNGGTGVFTVYRGADAAGNFSMGIAPAVADNAIGAAVNYSVAQNIEGYHVADLRAGAVDAQPFTVAFDVFASAASVTLPIALRSNAAPFFSCVMPFTTQVGAWKTIVLNVPAPISIAAGWEYFNGIGLRVDITLAAGSNFVAPSVNQWVAGNFISAAGMFNLMSGAAGEIQIRNFRLYRGSVDFGPDRRLYAEELALCQRYYVKTYNQANPPAAVTAVGAVGGNVGSTAQATISVAFPVALRATPTITFYSPVSGAAGNWRRFTGAADVTMTVNLGMVGENTVAVANSAGATSGEVIYGHLVASAEL